MKDSKKVRLLLLMVFLLSALSSACMGIVAYQLATGELPFEIEAQFKFRDEPIKVEEKIILSADVPIKNNKIDEATVHKEYLLFYEQRIKLKEKEQVLLDTQRRIEPQLLQLQNGDSQRHEPRFEPVECRGRKAGALEIARKLSLDLVRDVIGQRFLGWVAALDQHPLAQLHLLFGSGVDLDH